MKPMLAHVWEPHRVTFPCYVQPKFNGVRAVCGVDESGRRRFQSRDELPWDYEVLRHISESLDFLPKDLVLDGELYVHGWSLQRINAAITPVRKSINDDTRSVLFMVFDVVDYEQSFYQRMSQLDQYAANTEMPWRIAKTYSAAKPQDTDSFYASMIEAGYEGIMYRLGDCPYTVPKQPAEDPGDLGRLFLSDKNNRTWHLLKRKSWLDGEYPILRVEEGVGKRSGMVGAIVFDCGNGREGKVGSGLSDLEATTLFAEPYLANGRKVKVKYQTLTADGIPFHPTFECLT